MRPRARAFDAFEFGDNVIDLLAFDQFVDALGIARAAADGGHFADDVILRNDDHLARTNILRMVMERLFHAYFTIVP